MRLAPRLQKWTPDITGQTGLAIVDAILGGERNPRGLAKLRHERIQASSIAATAAEVAR